MTTYFKHLTNLPPLPKKYIQEGINSKFEFIRRPNLLWSTTSFDETNFYKLLKNQYGDCLVKYYQNPKNSLYDWHTDMTRCVTINWPIKTNVKASTYYRKPMQEMDRGSDMRPLFYHLTEIDYKIYRPTLLNTTFEHCVVNNYTEDRIIMSLTVLNNAKFDEVSNFLSTLQTEFY
jgi:hypothetical protein